MAMAQALKEKIRQRCQLACTVGVASNKLLAKLASGLGKPDGIRQITADQASAVMAVLPIQQLWTVGERTAERLQAAGIHRIGDLQQASATTLHRLLGPRGETEIDSTRRTNVITDWQDGGTEDLPALFDN